MITFVCQAQTESFSTFLLSMYERSANDRWIDTAHIIPGINSTVRIQLCWLAKLPAAACVDTMSNLGSGTSNGGSEENIHALFHVVHTYVLPLRLFLDEAVNEDLSHVSTYERSANNQWIDTAHIFPGSTVRTWLRFYIKLPAASYRLCRYHVPRGLTTLHRWILGKLTWVVLCRTYVCFLRLVVTKSG